ncbi:MAG: HAMP domain-containing histidine kinase [Candidatus Saccharibacteria bacterium]|nr:HAMP domain-containing histidine kinase [Candidatus Saccharibacteria bacterium]
MDQLHKTLLRQINRYLGDGFQASPELQKFFTAVSEAYKHADEDRELTERSFELSSKELAQINQNIEKEVENRTHELRLEHARFIASANSLNAGLIICDGAGVAIVLNRVARNILSYSPPTLKGTALPDKDIIWTTQTMNQRFGGAFDLEADMKLVIASRKPIEHKAIQFGDRVLRVFIAPVMDMHTQQDPDRLGSIIFLEDVTEAKILERSRDEFFSIASHELRTPLTAIKGNTSMMLNYFPDVFENHDLKDMVHDIYESSTRLIEIVNDFLDVSRLEQGKMAFKLKPFSIQHLIEKVIYEVKAMSKDNDVQISFDPMELNVLPMVFADPDRTKQVLYNLLGNALKFTEHGRISIVAGRDNTHFIKVWIRDTGRGIPLETQGILFHKFQQAGTSLLTRDTTRGTGLGLYISKLIMERMGGTIKLEQSTEGKGSIFSISLPIATVDPRISDTQSLDISNIE